MNGKAALYILGGVAVGLGIAAVLQALATANKVQHLAAQPMPKLPEGEPLLLAAPQTVQRRIGFA